jgi:hypothetical protein
MKVNLATMATVEMAATAATAATVELVEMKKIPVRVDHPMHRLHDRCCPVSQMKERQRDRTSICC